MWRELLKKLTKELKQTSVVYFAKITKLEEKKEELKKALEEIKGIAKTIISASNCSNCDGCGYYDGCQDDNCGDYAIRKIADKIDEVLRWAKLNKNFIKLLGLDQKN